MLESLLGCNESRREERFECLKRMVEVLEQIFILVQRKKEEKWKGKVEEWI